MEPELRHTWIGASLLLAGALAGALL